MTFSLIFSELRKFYCILFSYFFDVTERVDNYNYFFVEFALSSGLLIESFLHINSYTLYSSISFLHLFAVSLSSRSFSLKTSSKHLFLFISYSFNENLLFSCLKLFRLSLFTRVFCISNFLLLMADSSKVIFRIGWSLSGERAGLL